MVEGLQSCHHMISPAQCALQPDKAPLYRALRQFAFQIREGED